MNMIICFFFSYIPVTGNLFIFSEYVWFLSFISFFISGSSLGFFTVIFSSSFRVSSNSILFSSFLYPSIEFTSSKKYFPGKIPSIEISPFSSVLRFVYANSFLSFQIWNSTPVSLFAPVSSCFIIFSLLEFLL